MRGYFVLLVNLAVWGAHAALPFVLARAADPPRRRWAMLALPLLGASILATLADLHLAPDAAVAWGMTGILDGSTPARWVAVAVAALAVADLLLLAGVGRLGAAEWRVLGVVGCLGLAAQTLASELLRIGWGPVPPPAALYAAAALRLPLALAAGELAAGAPRGWTTAAGPALAAAWLLWPGALRSALRPEILTLAAAVSLLTAARFLPRSIARPTGIAGVLIAALLLARAGIVSAQLGGGEVLPLEWLAP